jgi:hypothetical protein
MAVSPEQRCPGPHSSAGSALPAAGGWVGPSCSFWRICNERLLESIQDDTCFRPRQRKPLFTNQGPNWGLESLLCNEERDLSLPYFSSSPEGCKAAALWLKWENPPWPIPQ